MGDQSGGLEFRARRAHGIGYFFWPHSPGESCRALLARASAHGRAHLPRHGPIGSCRARGFRRSSDERGFVLLEKYECRSRALAAPCMVANRLDYGLPDVGDRAALTERSHLPSWVLHTQSWTARG